MELIGRNTFPPIGDLPYLMMLPAYGFFWFRLSTDALPPAWHDDKRPLDDLPTLVLFDTWSSFFRSRVVPWRMGLADKTRAQFERQILPRYMQHQRWYAGKAKALDSATIVEHAMFDAGGESWLLAIVETRGAGTEAEEGLAARYFMPLAMSFEDRDEERTRVLGALAVVKVRQQAETGVIADAMGDVAFCRALVAAIGAGQPLRTEGGTLQLRPGAAFAEVVGDALAGPSVLRRLTASSNSISLLGDALFLKAYRRLQPGINPELEMGRFLTDVAGFRHSVPVAGSVEWVARDGRAWTLALLQAQVSNQGDAWEATVGQIERLLSTSFDDEGEATEAIAGMAERLQL